MNNPVWMATRVGGSLERMVRPLVLARIHCADGSGHLALIPEVFRDKDGPAHISVIPQISRPGVCMYLLRDYLLHLPGEGNPHSEAVHMEALRNYFLRAGFVDNREPDHLPVFDVCDVHKCNASDLTFR